jgi:hypothetical protein
LLAAVQRVGNLGANTIADLLGPPEWNVQSTDRRFPRIALEPASRELAAAIVSNTSSSTGVCGVGPHCSFCGTSTGPFSEIEGLFTVLICIPCLAVR